MCNFRNTKSMVTIFALELFFRMFTFGKVWFWEQASPAYLFTWTSHLGRETPITAFVLLPRPTKMMLKTSMLKRNIMLNILKCFFKNGPFPVSFFFIFIFSIQLTVKKCSINVADDWIQTVDLWYWKWLLYQLSHNHCPKVFVSLFNFCIICWVFCPWWLNENLMQLLVIRTGMGRIEGEYANHITTTSER